MAEPAHGLWPWLPLIGLGLFHGLNPAMGWLFAVAGVELRLFYAHEDTRRALAAVHELACGLLFLGWLFELHAAVGRP